MRYWWVTRNQTRQEIEGGYLWSPKRNKNGHRNPFYEFMREVAPGDIVFSFWRYSQTGDMSSTRTWCDGSAGCAIQKGST